MPPAITKKIELTITSTGDTNSPIPALLVAEKFQSLQNLLYVVGDFLEGNKYRTSGDFPKSVKERFTLVVRELKIGSVGATLGIADSQQGLFPQIPTNGEKAIDLTNEIVHIAQSDDDISKKIAEKIPDEPRAHRLIQEIDHLWPDNRSPFSIQLGFGQPRSFQLNPSRKPAIQRALHKVPEATEKTIVGRLIQIRVDKKHECRIDTPEGEFTCTYTPELEKSMKHYVGTMVGIIGQMKKNNGIEISSEKAIEQIPHLPLQEINFKNSRIHLKEPIILDVQYDLDEYILSNEPFHLLATSSSLKLGIQEIEEELTELWNDYVEVDADTLTQDAFEFRLMLKSFFAREGDVVGNA
ncbi:hypothetical protein [Methanosphaerula palustris]|uniref:Uncharacterized protein n=1 Tax=Methanosphaerula palustris (strain ATCC BAA-1556 / DSM 19958 / E1-9c) TaxID=521011 RepID=B8GGL2_METPE|nr:hypothetical protein [Methanosphaerula palustris]ACL16267.1 conserved hypothetical protein [Methanosphaerula palustris E1-9c]